MITSAIREKDQDYMDVEALDDKLGNTVERLLELLNTTAYAILHCRNEIQSILALPVILEQQNDLNQPPTILEYLKVLATAEVLDDIYNSSCALLSHVESAKSYRHNILNETDGDILYTSLYASYAENNKLFPKLSADSV